MDDLIREHDRLYLGTFCDGMPNCHGENIGIPVLTHALKVFNEKNPNANIAIRTAFGKVVMALFYHFDFSKLPERGSMFEHYLKKAPQRFQSVAYVWNDFVDSFALAFSDYTSALPIERLDNSDPFISVTIPFTCDPQKIMEAVEGPVLRLYNPCTVGYQAEYPIKKFGNTFDLTSPIFKPLQEISFTADIPPALRFQHTHIVAPPGTGKSNLLSHWIRQDLDAVAEGECSVIVMESNRDLADKIVNYLTFAGKNKDRLIYIDVEDVEHPPALNLFSLGQGDELSPRDKEAFYNSTVSMLDYVFKALLGAELTSRQSTLFMFSIQLLMEVRGATIDTMITLMEKNGLSHFRRELERLSPDAQRFFATKFDAKEFEQTKSQVTDRLFAIKRIGTLSRMFSSPETRLNLYEEMGSAKIIVINAARAILQDEGTEIFQRFMLALILLAAEKRALIEKGNRLPVHVYLDEAQDCLKRDDKIGTVLDQARKYGVSMTIAHQRLQQMQPHVLNALYGSTAIKIAANVQDADASALARNMNTTAAFIANQPPYTFAAFARGVTQSAGYYSPPNADNHWEPRMAPEQFAELRQRMRDRYGITPSQRRDEPDDYDPTKPPHA